MPTTRRLQYSNRGHRNELIAIDQNLLHARMHGSRGINQLDKHEFNETVDEMKSAVRLIERIPFLVGWHIPGDIGTRLIGAELGDAGPGSAAGTAGAVAETNDYCASVHDYVSRERPEAILQGESVHTDRLDTRHDLIDKKR